MNLREKKQMWLVSEVIPARRAIKNWYLHAGMKFLVSRKFSDTEETFLEEVTNFFLDNLENIEYEPVEEYEEA